LILLAFATAAIVLRTPSMFSGDVGFWAEEGRVYFQYAWQHGFWASLFAPHQGYFALLPNVATAIATTIPLELAPSFTVAFAAGAQILVVAIVVFGRAKLFESPGRRLLAVAIVLFAARTDEIWFNTITSQFHLSLAAALILLEPTTAVGRARQISMRAILVLAGLTGPAAASLAPAFACSAWATRDRERSCKPQFFSYASEFSWQ
jgi:hypothetical protein